MTYIEEVLRRKTNGQNNAILVGQWEYDKKLLPSALNTVALLFPHYSLHDESHSLSIIDNITRFLGKDTIDQMTTTDLWLILESAYSHDLGMIVTADSIENSFSNGEFLSFFKKVSSDSYSPIYKYAQYFRFENNKIVVSSDANIIEIHDATKFLLSSFFRSKHGEKSKEIIIKPNETIAVSSPRAIIPQRLYNILGDICMIHSKDYNEVMNLPRVEVGLGLDEAHPRFVASLLRLGDVLDIDNPRFSETLLKTTKEIPEDSFLHKEKHLSISHLRIDTKKIEITAECSNPKIAQVTQEWFNLIADEFNTQSLKWNDIVPFELDCHLPNINYLKTNIDGYIAVNENFKQSFTIDTPKALELLQGKNFYPNRYDAIRELLQNAVDSTLIRFFLDHENSELPTSPKNLYGLAKDNYAIDVTIREKDSKQLSVLIKDRGIGISLERLKYLTHTGSSSKDIEKQLIINRMPEWMHPSGIFGVGFQSIFLLTSQVSIITKDYATDKKMSLEMYGPNSDMKGEIFLRQISDRIDAGLTIEFEIATELLEETSLDPFFAIPVKTDVEKLTDIVRKYAKSSMIPIRINGNIIDRIEFDYFDPQTSIEIKIGDLSFPNSSKSMSHRYRNAIVSIESFSHLFIHTHVNLHYGNAKNLLTLSRERINSPELSSVKERITEAMVNYINSDEFGLKEYTQNELMMFALFVKHYKLKGRVNRIFANVEDFEIPTLSKTKLTLKELLDSKYVTFRCSYQAFFKIERTEQDNISIIASTFGIHNTFFYDYAQLLFDLLLEKKQNSCCKEIFSESGFLEKEYMFTDDENFTTSLAIDKVRSICRITPQRCFIHFIKGYDDIKIPATFVDDKINHDTDIMVKELFNFTKILSPFISVNGKVKDCRNDKFYKYVSDANRVPVERVKDTYERFVRDCRNYGLSFEY